jgi:predicted TIM-barrel fold metal-dependent hydrolase
MVPGMRDNLEAFLALELSDEIKRKLLQDNPDRLFGPAPEI